ncbi:MAG: hypothetical protein JST89_12110 [Cyanobacteria bacterium SZAS-4]|nr:hypothetical protein [Cyanobacteria bacterium SZAS-4]
MSSKNLKSASSEAPSNNNEFCSERGCYRTLQGWSPNRKQPTTKEESHQDLTPSDRGEADE